LKNIGGNEFFRNLSSQNSLRHSLSSPSEEPLPPAPPQVFSNITPERFATLSWKAGAAGIAFTGNSGTASKFGVEVTWNYSPEVCRLTIQCLNTPFFMSPETVYAKIKSIVQESAA
jgi:hypothetical protein